MQRHINRFNKHAFLKERKKERDTQCTEYDLKSNANNKCAHCAAQEVAKGKLT